MILSLVFLITGCENFGLNDEKDFGKLVVSKAYLEEDGSEVTSGTVKVDGKEAGFGEEIVLAKGTYRVTITDESGNTTTEEGIVIKVAETTIINDAKLIAPPDYNAWKFTFNPEKYGLSDIGEVHLVGDNFGWNAEDKTYSLIKQEDGTFTGVFEVAVEGDGFKFIYDGDNWDNQIGDSGEPGDEGSGNINV